VIPGYPAPGQGHPFPALSDLVTLQSFSIYTQAKTLKFEANFSAIDPIPPSFDATLPSLPLLISLPGSNNSLMPVAEVEVASFPLTYPNITTHVSGSPLPLHQNGTSTISAFLTRYLSGLPNPISISTSLLPGTIIPAHLPAINPRPQILQNVTIRDMKIVPGTPFLASGTVFARVVLPSGFHIGLNVSRILPDVLVFDGEITAEGPPPPAPPLPDPLPRRAFARIRTDSWVPAESEEEISGPGAGTSIRITAKIVEVPLEVLPGREKEFSNFVSKVGSLFVH
jgi:hypothetical protein